MTANFLAINDVSDAVNENDEDSNELWKLPSIDYTGVIPIGETGMSFDWDADYVNYYREEGTGGHRIDIHPKVSSSIPLSPYLESRAELGVRDTYYIIETFGDATWDEDDTQNRLLADFEIEIASTLLREFDTDGDSEWNFDHQFRPFMTYNYIPDVDQDELPDWDSIDFVDERNGITYGIDNYFTDLTGNSNRDYGFVKLFQTYDFTDSDEPFSDVSLRVNLKPVPRWTFVYDLDWDPYDDGLYKHRLETYYTNTRGDYFSVDYSYNDRSDIDQINAYLNAALFSSWYTKLELEHSIAEEETNNFNVALIYKALCWSVEFETRYTPEEMKYLLVFNLANIGTPLGISY